MIARRSGARSPQRWLGVAALALALVTIGLLGALGLLGAAGPGALMMAPAGLMALALLAGRYPGERLIERLSRVRGATRAATAGVHRPRRRTVTPPRGGLLLASRLAGRAPPVPAAG